MTLHQLRLFAAVARERSFARAAQSLYLSEATVSLQIKELEGLIGARLLERSPGRRRVEVTEAGRLLLRGYRRASEELEGALDRIAELQGCERGSVTFGSGSQFGSSLLPLVIGAFRRDHPGIVVGVELDRREHLVEGLRRHRLDLAVLVDPGDEADLEVEPLAEYDVFLVGPHGHRLAQPGSQAAFAELASEPLILPGYSGTVRQKMEQLAAEAGIRLNVVLELFNVEAQIQAVNSNMGIAALTSFSAAPRVAAGEVSVLRIQGIPIALRWYVVYPRDRLAPAAQGFKDFLLHSVALIKANAPGLPEPSLRLARLINRCRQT
jgi:molybdate transport repressor ModE-like protein